MIIAEEYQLAARISMACFGALLKPLSNVEQAHIMSYRIVIHMRLY